MKFAIEVSSEPSRTVRAQQLSAAFDVPRREKDVLRWSGDLPLDDRDWNVGLIVGPSGSGKTTCLEHIFGAPLALTWQGEAVVDDFPSEMSIENVTAACSAVGFNTIPAWLRKFDVLSTGEQFRVALARTLVETPPGQPIVVDEFTSVVDRQIAKIGANAAQKWARREQRQLVAATCHYDVIEWLQPDWVFEPATADFEWRCLQPRPALTCTIRRVHHSHWQRYARFHYLTASLHHAATCFELEVEGVPATFAAFLHRPHPHAKRHRIKGISRLVTLPDWQGLGLAFALVDRVSGAYNALGQEVHMYPAHPSLIRSFDRSPAWTLVQKPGQIGRTSTGSYTHWKAGRRPNAVFRYVGERIDRDAAEALIAPRDASSRTT